MSSLANYYFYVSTGILLPGICDFIFKALTNTPCYTNNKAGLFMFMGILNIIITLLMWLEGFLINYYLDLTPDEIKEMGLIKKIMCICSKVFPMLVKVLFYIKILICLILVYFAYFNNKLEEIKDNGNSADGSNNCEKGENIVNNYKQRIMIFEAIEIGSIFLVIFLGGCIKQIIEVEGEFYVPRQTNLAKWRLILLNNLGP